MSVDVLVVMERSGAGFHRMSWEALAAGQKLAAEVGAACSVVVVGKEPDALAAEVAGKKLAGVWSVKHELLADYTADGWTAALAGVIAEAKPGFVVFPHTYQVRDFAPKLATRRGEVLISDVTGFTVNDGKPVFTRQWMQGKLNASYAHKRDGVCFLSVQAGSFRGDAVEAGDAACALKTFAPEIEAEAIRTKPGEAFREAAQTVDLSAASMIVSVGRGIGEQDNLGLVEELASALGAEMAASRPICDAGWMAMERQVGSSGQTVAPKVYLAVGISGAIQHLVGMKGAKMVVAINKDPEAPIFEVADVGVVGDLFEVVPALTRAVLAAKG